MDSENLVMDESGISLGFDLEDPSLIDISDLLPEDFLQGSPPEMEAINYYEILSKPAPVQSPSFKSETVSSRTQLKQQLMKDQLLKEKERRKAEEAQEQANKVRQRPAKVPINMQNVALPQHVLQVRTGLQNPTKYHILEKQKNQVLQFLSSSQKDKPNFGVKEAPAPVVHRQSAAPVTAVRPSSSFTVPAPAVSPGLQSVTSGGTSDAEEVLDGILAYEESSLDAQTRSLYGSNASLESGQQRLKSESYGYEDPGRDRVKKDTHNMIERRRRYNINDRIKELGDLLPQRNEPHYDLVRDSRANKGTILKSSVDYIKVLKNDVNKMKKIEVDNRQLQQENRKLLLRIQQLEIAAQAKGVTLAEKTWRPAEPEAIIEQYIRAKPRRQMPDVVTEAACVYDESMEEVPRADPMLSAAAALPPLPLSPSLHMDTQWLRVATRAV